MTETQPLTIYDPNGTQLPLGIINSADATTSTIEPISSVEAEMLTHYETIIEQGEQTIIEVGQALSAINRGRLYRAQYGSFDEYCRAKWDFGRKRGYELMRAGQMAEELSGAGLHLNRPTERQLRAAAKLSSTKDRVRAFQRAKEMAGEKKVSSRHIEEAVNEILGMTKPVIIDVTPEPESSPDGDEGNVPRSTAAVLVASTTDDKETNEQAIDRLFSSIREFAESKQWQPAFHDLLNELERRVERLKDPLAKAA
jgi:hypothetical protein